MQATTSTPCLVNPVFWSSGVGCMRVMPSTPSLMHNGAVVAAASAVVVIMDVVLAAVEAAATVVVPGFQWYR